MENANSNEVVNYNKEIDIIDNPNQKSNNCSKRKIIILITSLLIGIIINYIKSKSLLGQTWKI